MNNKDKKLGMGKGITRRDFVQSTLLGTGAALLSANAPISYAYDRTGAGGPQGEWYGYGGVGDYAASHGNTPGVVNTAHNIRDGLYNKETLDAIDTGEVYDLLIVGAGLSGLGAAYEHSKHAQANERCLILENHPMFGGEAKRNEFEVDGCQLIGPQGANGFSVPNSKEDRKKYADIPDLRYMRELGIPFDFEYGSLVNSDKDINLARDNYGYQYWQEDSATVAHFVRGKSSADSRWALDPLENGYADMDLDEKDRQDLADWREHNFETPDRPDFDQWLDTISYKQYIEDILGFSPVVTRWADPIVAGGCGVGCDGVSAFGAQRLGMPIRGEKPDYDSWTRNSLPGGNDGFARHFVKKIMPHAIKGGDNFEDIIAGKVNFERLDAADKPIRMRLKATVVRVEHEGNPDTAKMVSVVYEAHGKVFRVRAKRVVMASGGWVNKHAIRDLPVTYHKAYESFYHMPFMIANVAVKNWRFLEKLGTGACMWRDGVFGNSCNVRLPMKAGGHQSELDPDKPAVVTFYVSYESPGMPSQAQGVKGRWELFSTSYAEFERKIRLQMLELFGDSGFDPKEDIAGIVLNRWGHAYLAPQPGFFFGNGGKPAGRDVISQNFGRIAIAHAELDGIQHWGPAADQGKRAVRQLADLD
jgi:spermidine dehydrogenase|tara:strand:+ start:994 stop:2925 length:1932 start_codon:yes stop_codon:yes gene_type:complete